MSSVDEYLSFRQSGNLEPEYKGHKWKPQGRWLDRRQVLRNSLGWELRCLSPAMSCEMGGSFIFHPPMWRWEVFTPEGRMVGSEPSVRWAADIAYRHIMGISETAY